MTTQPATNQPPSVEERLSRLEGGYDRIGDLVQQVAGLRTDMNAQFEGLRAETNQRIAETNQRIESLREETGRNARTVYVLLSTSWLALMLTTVGINFLTSLSTPKRTSAKRACKPDSVPSDK